MDLSKLRRSYEIAGQQIKLLENHLIDLLVRQRQDGNHDNSTENDYLSFKISITRSVLNMYEEYQEIKWKELQMESTLQLNEVIHGISSGRVTPGDDLDIHMFPAPISEISDLLSRLPSLPQYGQYHHSRSLTASTFDDMPLSRDY